MDPKQRFSTRVENYIRYRPGYPAEVIQTLQAECGLNSNSVVADVGSGTGLLAARFLELGCTVYGIEPNADMRQAGERLLVQHPNFTSLDGSAEATGLPPGSVDLVSAGQAFHWFDPVLARQEFLRILRAPGWVALVWNERRTTSTPFLREYEDLLDTCATDYNQVNHRHVEEDPEIIPRFYSGSYHVVRFDNIQQVDYEGLKGRLLSSSYTPELGQPGYESMLEGLRRIFNQYQVNGLVDLEYDTRLFYGKIK